MNVFQGRRPSWLFHGVLAVLAGVAMLGCPRGLETRHLVHDGIDRSYELFVPDNPTEDALPLVVVLHGLGQQGRAIALVTEFHELGAREGFMVAYPNGLRRSLNFGAFAEPDDVGFVLAVIEDIGARHPLDWARVYVTGASNGGFMTHRMACDAGEVFAAAAPVMATLTVTMAERCMPAAPLPMLMIHGTGDRIVPFDDVEAGILPNGLLLELVSVPETVAFWLDVNGLPPIPEVEAIPDRHRWDETTTTLERYGGGGVEVLLYRVEGGGHTWPGSMFVPPGYISGRTSRDFSATEVIWEFFRRHAREPAEGENGGG